MAAVSSLPELTERKRVLDKHTNMATALLAAIKVIAVPGRRRAPVAVRDDAHRHFDP